MNVKTVIAVTLSLLFQWAQVSYAAVSTEKNRDVCPVQCDCCSQDISCPCAKDQHPGPERPSHPALPDNLKLPASKLADTRFDLEQMAVPQGPISEGSPFAPGSTAGYSGVRLSVAFCSFVM
jgi:hypothetical protein